MSLPDVGAIASEPLGPKAAAEAAIVVEAVPDDGTGAAPGATSAPAPDENVAAWDELLTFGLTIATRFAAGRWPAMVTTPEEIAAVSGAWSPICARRWPIAMTPEIAACIVTLTVFSPKIVAAVSEEKTRKAEEAQARREKAARESEREREAGSASAA